MRTDDFDYPLPDELIAQEPVEPRDSCRLLVLDRKDGSIKHGRFRDVIDYLDPGDLLVANRTRVLPARLMGHKQGTGGVAETLLLKRREDLDALGHVWECLVKPGKRLKRNARIEYHEGGVHAPLSRPVVLIGEVIDYLDDNRGGRLVRFEPAGGLTLDAAIHKAGHVPLPPYITEYEGDPERYQTVYAMHEEHSAAAPTAGLHFTPELIERYHVSQEVVDAAHATKAAGHRVIAVGTTSVRSLESAFAADVTTSEPACVAQRFEDAADSARMRGRGDIVERRDATTNLYLMPGSTFHVVDAMITNFHAPRSTLMMLVSAFATREQIMGAYQAAMDERYRFLSFGDAMLIL